MKTYGRINEKFQVKSKNSLDLETMLVVDSAVFGREINAYMNISFLIDNNEKIC